MRLSARILGKGIVEVLAETASAPLLTIGSDAFRRGDLASIGCFNFMAAARLTKALKDLGAKNTRDVFNTIPPEALVLPGVGSISLAVLGAAFEHHGLGGDQPLEAWMSKHRPEGVKREYITFDTMKHREHEREPGEARARKARRTRAHGRRDAAHRLRVDRYTKRREGN